MKEIKKHLYKEKAQAISWQRPILLFLAVFLLGLIAFQIFPRQKEPIVVGQSDEEQAVPNETVPNENTLVIPKLGVTSLITEGNHEAERTYTNVWRQSHSSSPDQGGNTVVVGHRWKNLPKGYPLYYIDKIETGDEITVYWKGKKYQYEVYNTEIVEGTKIEIEDNTSEPILTLYACDWTGKKRLVVQAKLIE